MTIDQFDGTHVFLRQSKTNQRVNVKVHEDLMPYLEQVRAHAIRDGILRAPVVHDAGWNLMTLDRFSKAWDRVARACSVYGKLQRRDLRRTAVVRLDQASVKTGNIAAVTGHSEASINGIIEVYRVRTTESAAIGIAGLERLTRARKGNKTGSV